MQSKATSPEQYLKELPPDRREVVSAVRDVVRKNLPKGYAEGMQYGMIGYFIPHSIYPPGYHCDPRQPLPFAHIASQKSHVGLYLFCIYGDEAEKARFESAWKKTGKKLDMGKACVRVKKLEDVPLAVVGETIARIPVDKFIARYEKNLASSPMGRKVLEKAANAKGAKVSKKGAKKATKKTSKKAGKKAARKKAPSKKKVARKKAPKASGKKTGRAGSKKAGARGRG
ncbi:MAG: DUF1801 domain-containing protein [Phycisphaerales bacterium]